MAGKLIKAINISQRLSARFQIILTRQLMVIFKLLFQDSMPATLMSEIVLLTLILLMPNGKWKFEAACSGQNIKTVRFKEITGFSSRSEERRVGKECRSRWSPYH